MADVLCVLLDAYARSNSPIVRAWFVVACSSCVYSVAARSSVTCELNWLPVAVTKMRWIRCASVKR